ncbi:MAG: asparagine synthase (glutamine-hydrolyzing) [Planctomycetes bacterium]|nr:asparagine synthase (glutamine-hydrolyzing) [Planctomycetota bacterium]
MCGIAGSVWTAGTEPLERGVLDRMTDVLSHRGPDGRGTHYELASDGSGTGLGHRRLSIIDLAGGGQPLANEDNTIWITYNGEVYNYRELREDLLGRGHIFRTDSDTEVLVHLYEEYGVECLQHMRGMFAFAIWDGPRRQLLLARDRLGKKPVVYCEQPGRLLFASEIKSLLLAPGVARVLDPVALDEYLTYNYVPHPRTMFAGIRKLPPAHYALYRDGRLTIAPYWTPDFHQQATQPREELCRRLAERLDESVKLRLRSDVPLGAFLSGGIDSTAIVGLMQRNMTRPVQTYTIGFPVSGFDETPFAQIAADHLKTDHHVFHVQPASVGILPILTWHFDEPFADSSAIPTYFLSQVTAQHVKVALTGDGGDELFAGYPRYQTYHNVARFDSLPGFLRSMIANPLWRHISHHQRESSFTSKLRFRMELLREPADRRYLAWVSGFHPQQREALYSNSLRMSLRGAQPEQFLINAMARAEGRDAGSRARITDLLTYLPGDLLTKVDITSMAHGLECRCPFLDHHVVELAMSIGFADLNRGAGAKPMLTDALPTIIPPAIRTRPKMGFRIPLDTWFRGELKAYAHDMLLSPQALQRGYFERAGLQRLLEEHGSGRWNHGDRIWSLLCLEMWNRTFIDPSEPPTQSSGAISSIAALEHSPRNATPLATERMVAE